MKDPRIQLTAEDIWAKRLTEEEAKEKYPEDWEEIKRRLNSFINRNAICNAPVKDPKRTAALIPKLIE
jgi:hypothetical protein